MEVIEDGNIMDRIPILLQRDLEYYQTNQTVLSEKICRGVVGGRLDFPRNASFAAVKIVRWLEDEFSIAFKQGSGMFVTIDEEKTDGGVAKTSDPDKFVQLAIKSSDSLLEHLHMLAQEALDHADLPVLTATLGAAALLKNSLYCYVQHVEDTGNSERHSLLQACYKRYVTMSEAVGERVLDLHNRVLSLYILQDSGGRPIDHLTGPAPDAGTPSVQGWWLYMNGSRKDLWDTVPPRMAQRIFAGMLNETLTILTVRYCQTNTTDATTPLLINDILNILLCVAQLLPSICARGADLAGLDAPRQARAVRDVHAKCNELFKCMVCRGAELHFIHQVFTDKDEPTSAQGSPFPWFTFASPHLFGEFDNIPVKSIDDLPDKTAIGLELDVLLAQPQPSWPLLIKVLRMRGWRLARALLARGARGGGGARWPAHGRWLHGGARRACAGALCTADGFCTFQRDRDPDVECARATGALTYVVASVGSEAELKATLGYALETAGGDWAACLDKRQVWCDRRPSWLAGLLALVGTALRFVPPVLVDAILAGASMYQTMSLCLACVSRALGGVPRGAVRAARVLQRALPAHVAPAGGSVLLQLLVTVVYEELHAWAAAEADNENAVANGEAHDMNMRSSKPKHVRIVSRGHTDSSRSVSFDGSCSSPAGAALAVAEALCSIAEDDKHTAEIEALVALGDGAFALSDRFGLEDLPEFAQMFDEDGAAGGAAGDAAARTELVLMSAAGRDSVRVIYEHLRTQSARVLEELGLARGAAPGPSGAAPLLYTMFHAGSRPFDQFLRGEWPMPWSKLVAAAKAWSGIEGAKVHITKRADMRTAKAQGKGNKHLMDLYNMFKSNPEGLL